MMKTVLKGNYLKNSASAEIGKQCIGNKGSGAGQKDDENQKYQALEDSRDPGKKNQSDREWRMNQKRYANILYQVCQTESNGRTQWKWGEGG